MKFSELLETVKVGEKNVLDVIADGTTRTVVIESRRLLPEEPRAPKRAESPARRHEFLDAESFAAYLAKFGAHTAGGPPSADPVVTVVFADPERQLVSAVLDETTPDGFEIVTMKPQVHPLWAPWEKLAGNKVPVEVFAQFVQENRRSIVAPDGRDLAITCQQIRASVSVEIQKGRGKKAVNGIKITTAISGGATQENSEELPDQIIVKVPLYVQTEPREVELDLCIEADTEGQVKVLVTSGTVSEAKVAAFEGMVKTIREGLSRIDAVVTFGRPAHADWRYLPELPEKSAPAPAAPTQAYPR